MTSSEDRSGFRGCHAVTHSRIPIIIRISPDNLPPIAPFCDPKHAPTVRLRPKNYGFQLSVDAAVIRITLFPVRVSCTIPGHLRPLTQIPIPCYSFSLASTRRTLHATRCKGDTLSIIKLCPITADNSGRARPLLHQLDPLAPSRFELVCDFRVHSPEIKEQSLCLLLRDIVLTHHNSLHTPLAPVDVFVIGHKKHRKNANLLVHEFSRICAECAS